MSHLKAATKGILQKRCCQKFDKIQCKKPVPELSSCEFCEISKNTFLTEHFWATASENIFLVKE